MALTSDFRLRIAATFSLGYLCFGSLVSSHAAVPLLPFQGYLSDASGGAAADGRRLVQFKIYDSPIGGRAIWAGEIHQLSINAGLVNTVLGSKTSLGEVDFETTVYLELTVDANQDDQITAADPPLLPRQLILPAVFALDASRADDSDKLGGRDWSSILADGATDPSSGALNGAKLAHRTVGTEVLRDRAITNEKIAQGAINLDSLSDELRNLILREDPVLAGEVLITRMEQTAEVIEFVDKAISISNSSPKPDEGALILELEYQPLGRGNDLVIEATAWLSELTNHSNVSTAAVFIKGEKNARAVGVTFENDPGEAHHGGGAHLTKKIHVPSLEPLVFQVKIPAQRAGHWFGVYKTPGLSPQRGLSDSVVPTGSVIG